jgi:hypothetical protein
VVSLPRMADAELAVAAGVHSTSSEQPSGVA